MPPLRPSSAIRRATADSLPPPPPLPDAAEPRCRPVATLPRFVFELPPVPAARPSPSLTAAAPSPAGWQRVANAPPSVANYPVRRGESGTREYRAKRWSQTHLRETHSAGLEPATLGSEDRCSIQ